VISSDLKIISSSKSIRKIDDLFLGQAGGALNPFDSNPAVLPLARNCISMRGKKRVFLQERKEQVRNPRACIPLPHLDEAQINQALQYP